VRRVLGHPVGWRVARALVLGALLAGAAAAGTSAVQAWRVDRDAAEARGTYVASRAAAAHEESALRNAHAHPRSQVAQRAFFANAQLQTTLLTELQSRAPASQRPLIRGIEQAHAAAVTAAARSLGWSPGYHHQFARALKLLERVRQGTAAGASDLRIAGMAPWPRSTLNRMGLADLALLGLLGILTLLGHLTRALGLRRPTVADTTELTRLMQVARSDNLTGLGNQRAFQDDLRAAMERRNKDGTPFSLLAFDLDGLKQVNDAQGHQAGDSYIRTVASSIREGVNGGGTVYRTGGDEFMAILLGVRAWHAFSTAHAVQRLASRRTGRRALSIGITESTDTEGRRLLLHQADLALYEAKRAKLLAVTYHAGLEPRQPDAGAAGPNQHQKLLAAALAQAVDAKDAGTRNHSETVAELCTAIGAGLGITGERLERLRLAGLLHDVGKIGVSDAVLMKRGALRAEERSEVQLHTSVGHSILTSAELHREAVWVLHHHERFDGKGYPTGLAGEAIPLEARIIAVADAFEAMTGSRPYRSARTPEQALAELEAHSGSQFDPRCVDALCAAFGGVEESAPAPAPVAAPAPAALAAAATA